MVKGITRFSTPDRKKTGSFWSKNTGSERKPFFQPKLTVGPSDDIYEREADAVADRIMRQEEEEEEEPIQAKISPLAVQRMCPECEEEETLQRKNHGREPTSREVPPIVDRALRTPGMPLDADTRSYMENRIGYDFSNVKIHTGPVASGSAQSIQALAYTSGNNIVFNEGQYAPGTPAGNKLLAHELTHVVQQNGIQGKPIQRSSDFCTPYATAAEAADAEWWLRNTYMRLEGIETFGTEVYNLYDSYLSRSPGDSLAPRVFDSDGSYIHNSFQDDGYIKDDMDSVLDLVAARLHRIPGGPLRPGVWTLMSLSNFLSRSEMDNRPINFSNPFSVSGHIAGDIGSSDAGDDYRKITRANVAITKVVLFGNTGYHLIELIPHYEVFDTIDFCPGDPGSPAEQLVTTTMSRLEASGEAYDMPFKVIFSPEPRSGRYVF